MVKEQFRISLLGQFMVAPTTQRPLPTFRRKTRALLAYLVAMPQPHTRQALMDLFCQDAQAPARALSLLLSRIRRQLDTEVLITHNNSVQFNAQSAWVDYAIFQKQLSGDLLHKPVADIETAVSLYRGEFLEGLTLPDAPEFELWLLGQRAHASHLLENGLLTLAQRFSQDDAYDKAFLYTRQLLHHNPLLEEAHAQLIWLYAQMGQRKAALAQYDQCCALLQTELGVAPTDTLQTLQADILSGKVARPLRQTKTGTLPAALPSTPDFVGRTGEMAHLQTAWHNAQTGVGSATMIGAVAGSGKTRLVSELTRHLPQDAVYTGRCYESTRTLPYQPWLEILETHLQQLDAAALQQLPPVTQAYMSRLLPGMARRLPQTDAASGVLDEPERMFTAVVDFLCQTPTGHLSPRLLFVDDLQWADETSLRLLHYISQRINRFPRLLIGAYRTEEAADTPALTMLLDDFARDGSPLLTLSPLDSSEIETLAVHLWPQLAPGYRVHIAAMLAQATGGNALFVTAVLQELASSDHIPADLPVPATIQDLMQRRLRRLPSGSRQVLEALAVLNDGATWPQLQQISARDDEETAQALDWGLRWGLVAATSETEATTAPTRYQFQHDLIREAVYATLSTMRKQRLHQRTAGWLARIAHRQPDAVRQEMAARILYHAQRGEAYDLIFDWAPLAAAHARHMFAYRDTMHALDAMRDAFDQLQLTPNFDADSAEPILFNQLIEWLAHCWVLGKSAAEEQAVLHQTKAILARHPSPLRTAQLQLITAQIGLTYAEVVPAAQDAHRQFMQLGKLSLAAESLALAASASITISQNKNGRYLYEQALSFYQQANDVAGEVRCLSGLAWTALNLGAITIALRHLQQALSISQAQGDKLGEAQALFGLSAAWSFYHVPGKMVSLATASKQLYEQIGFQARAIRPLLYLGAAHDVRGNRQEALTVYEETLLQALAFEDNWLAGWTAQLAGRIYLHEGQLAEAEAKLRQAQELRLTSGERQNQVSDLAWLGRLALAQGDMDAALQHTAQAIEQLDAFHGEFYVWEQPDVLMCRVEALAAAGEMTQASAIARRAQADMRQFAQQIDDPAILAQYLAYPLNAKVETAVNPPL